MRGIYLLATTLLLATALHAEEIDGYALTNVTTVTDFDRFEECDVCPEMMVMPLRSFLMGAIRGRIAQSF